MQKNFVCLSYTRSVLSREMECFEDSCCVDLRYKINTDVTIKEINNVNN